MQIAINEVTHKPINQYNPQEDGVMAKLIKLEGLLRFQDSENESKTEQKKTDSSERMVKKSKLDFSPFQRVKAGAGDFFLAPGAIPEPQAVN